MAQFRPEDVGLVLELLGVAQKTAAPDCPHVQRALDAVSTVLAQSEPGQSEPGGERAASSTASASGVLHSTVPAPSTSSTTAELSAQVSAAAERLTALRKGVMVQVVEEVCAQAEALRPALQTADLTLSAVSTTPGKADRRRSMDVDAVPPTAALHLSEDLNQAVDKLPALRARLDEVSRRMTNVLRAIEEQRSLGRSQPTPLRGLTPLKRAAEQDFSVVGVVARATCQ
ncbi:hypothetical protein TSOC_000335 [Tetrabaena socialis]|uniref:Uncharacterized protein n=1 Tax=Tetrabaena socialis TaxID=47790 RepID=A0A2J8AJG4_9CHLO|nr:hypothetical protein TSOC_000335 [Tetrabaena socialis]|eukprot:PNH12654.1 hypothetical protein TSOC_000335 [Tetrabaena socialis]